MDTFAEDTPVATSYARAASGAGLVLFGYVAWTVAREPSLPLPVRVGVPLSLVLASGVGLLLATTLVQRVRFDGATLRATLGPVGFAVNARDIAEVHITLLGRSPALRRGYRMEPRGSRTLILWQREVVVLRTRQGRRFAVGTRRAKELAGALQTAAAGAERAAGERA